MERKSLRKKIDSRIVRTKRDLANALETLLEKKSFEDITIKEICEQAMVAKLTFYNNFKDKNDLLVYLFERLSEPLYEQLKEMSSSEPNSGLAYKDALTIVVHYFYLNKEKFRSMISNDKTYLIYWSLNNFISEITPQIAELYSNLNKSIKVPKEIASAYVSGVISTILYKAPTFKKYTEGEFVSYIYQLTTGKIFNA